MQELTLYHNAGAGGDGPSEKELISMIEECGFKCRLSSSTSVKDKEIREADFIVIAGGDGTVRKLTKELLDKKINSTKPPIALLPLGTANNIAKTLNITGEPIDIIRSWQNSKLKKFDVGILDDDDEDQDSFFLESFGYGMFPYLMLEMQKHKEKNLEPGEKMQKALEILHQILLSYPSKDCSLIIDGKDHSGKFLLVEIMNTRSIGPNLFLSPQGDPGDGIIEVVVVPVHDKDKFASYVSKKIGGIEEDYQFQTIKASDKISISWDGTHVHIDDEIVKLNKSDNVNISFRKGLLQFLIPQHV